MHDTAKENFDRWFGASKVVGPQGKPVVVYHASGHDIHEFLESVDGEFGRGIYATASTHYANTIADMRHSNGGDPLVYPIYVSMQNPLVVRGSARRQLDVATSGEIRAKAEQKGHDGIIQIFPGETLMRQMVVFRPEQIKSAIGNSGAFNQADPDITDRRSAAQSALDYLANAQHKRAVPHA